MTPENSAEAHPQAAGTTPENRHGRRPAPLSAAMEDLAGQYQAHLARSPLAGQTPRTYASAVRGYLGWLDGGSHDGDPLGDPAARDWAVRDYRSHLVTARRRAPATVNKNMAALADFYTWRGLGPPAVRRQPIQRAAPKALSPRESLRFLRAAEAAPSIRDRAIAETLFYTGARIAEGEGLDVDAIAMSARKGAIRLVGKGEKSRTLMIHPRLRTALTGWLPERQAQLDALAQRKPESGAAAQRALFVTRRGTRMTDDAMRDVITKIAAIAGLKVSPHGLRHTFATTMLRAGHDPVLVAAMLGHEGLDTLMVYTLPSEEDQEQALGSLPADE